MNDDMLVLAGREVGPLEDRLRRYCGLPWSGGDPETWAWRFYDTVEDPEPDRLRPDDVTTAAAMHPGLSRSDLAWFWDHTPDLDEWLGDTTDVDLAAADVTVLDQLRALTGLSGGMNLGLLTKVLHRKRPGLVPIAERRLIDWYRPITGERSATAAWPKLIDALAADLRTAHNAATIERAVTELGLPNRLTALRAADICVWIGAER